MSTQIDERILSMKFDNKNFENNVHTSLGTIQELKDRLDFSNSSKGLDAINTASKNISFQGISNGLETVKMQFSALQVMGITALANITNSAVNAGKNIVSALTIDPIKSGFGSYETKINAVKTVMSGTGESADQVRDSLNDLNKYSDKTIYSFEDMTSNISKFTNAGLSSKQAATAIKGISNVAAISGANANEASRAMYNFGQSLSQGSVKLMDWKSIETANMATVGFKTQLLDAAVAAGTLKKGVNGMYTTIKGTPISATKGFNESLDEQWLTSKALTNTLADYASETTNIGKKANAAAADVTTFTQMMDTMKDSVKTGWTKTWEGIIGNNDQSKKLFTNINNAFESIIGPSTDARNAMISFWNANGGRDMIISAITKSFHTLQDILAPVGQAFREIFPATTGRNLVEFSKSIKEVTDKFKIGEDAANNIKRTFAGLFAVLDIGKQIIMSFLGIFGGLLNIAPKAGGGILNITGSIGDFIVSLDSAIKKSGVLKSVVETLNDIFATISDKVSLAFNAISKAVGGFGSVDCSGFDKFTGHIKSGFEPLATLGNFLSDMIKGIINVFSKFGALLAKAAAPLTPIFDNIKTEISNFISGTPTLDIINTGLFATLLILIKKLVTGISSIGNMGNGFMKNITGILNGVQGCLKSFQTNLNSKTLTKIAVAIGILAVSLYVLASIDPGKLAGSLVAMGVLITELYTSLFAFEKIAKDKKFKSITKVALSMIFLSTAVLILSSAMTKISKLNYDDIIKGLVSIAVLSKILVKSASAMSGSTKGLVKGSLGLILFAVAINILVKAVEKLSKIDVPGLAKGLIGVGILLTELSLFMKYTDLGKMSLKSSIGIFVIAVALDVLSRCVSRLSKIDSHGLIKGLGGIGVLLVELSLFMKYTDLGKMSLKSSIGIFVIAVALDVLSRCVSRLSKIDSHGLIKGLGGIGVLLVELSLFMKYTDFSKMGIKSSIGILVLAVALEVLVNCVSKLGDMSLEQLGKGLGGLAVGLLIMGVALKYMETSIKGSLSILIFAGALEVLAIALILIGSMSLENIGKSLLMLSGLFVVFGYAASALKDAIPTIMGLAGAIALIGLACLAVGVGMFAFGTGLGLLAASGAAAAKGLGDLIIAVANMIPLIMEKIGEGIIAFCNALVAGMPAICAAVVVIVDGIVSTLVTTIPVIVNGALQILSSVLTALVTWGPILLQQVLTLLLACLGVIASNIGQFVTAGVSIVVGFVDGVASNLGAIVQSAFNLVISFINSLADAIRNNADAIGDACWNLVTSVVDAIASQVWRFVDAGANAVKGFIKGFASLPGKIWNAGFSMGDSAASGARRSLDEHSPSKVFSKIGEFASAGFVIGLKSYNGKIGDTARAIGGTAIDTLHNAVSNIADVVSGNFNMDPTIRPVLDLGAITSGAGTIDSLLSNQKGINVDLISTNTNSVGSAMQDQQNIQNGGFLSNLFEDLKSSIRTEMATPTNMSGTLSVQVVNDDGKIIGIAQTAIKDLLRRESR